MENGQGFQNISKCETSINAIIHNVLNPLIESNSGVTECHRFRDFDYIPLADSAELEILELDNELCTEVSPNWSKAEDVKMRAADLKEIKRPTSSLLQHSLLHS